MLKLCILISYNNNIFLIIIIIVCLYFISASCSSATSTSLRTLGREMFVVCYLISNSEATCNISSSPINVNSLHNPIMNNIWYTQTESHEYGYIQMEISERIHNWLTRMPEYPDVHSLQQDQPCAYGIRKSHHTNGLCKTITTLIYHF